MDRLAAIYNFLACLGLALAPTLGFWALYQEYNTLTSIVSGTWAVGTILAGIAVKWQRVNDYKSYLS